MRDCAENNFILCEIYEIYDVKHKKEILNVVHTVDCTQG